MVWFVLFIGKVKFCKGKKKKRKSANLRLKPLKTGSLEVSKRPWSQLKLTCEWNDSPKVQFQIW
jgi:hypothetical protein